MQPQVEMMNVVLDELETNLELFDTIKINGLPIGGGISCEISPGYNKSIFLNKQSSKVIPLLFLCKSKDQITALDSLSMICNYLQELKAYPNGTTFDWVTAETATEPNLVSKQENGYYIYSCIVNIVIYF